MVFKNRSMSSSHQETLTNFSRIIEQLPHCAMHSMQGVVPPEARTLITDQEIVNQPSAMFTCFSLVSFSLVYIEGRGEEGAVHVCECVKRAWERGQFKPSLSHVRLIHCSQCTITVDYQHLNNQTKILESLYGGPHFSTGVHIFMKCKDQGVQIFRNIWTGGNKKGGPNLS